MFETLAPASSREEVLASAVTARDTERTGAADLLRVAAQWAEAHPVAEGAEPAGWGETDLHGEGVVPLAGAGAPLVAEFAPMELAAVLGISHDAVKALIGEALELKHRLPRLWDLVQELRCPAWVARKIAVETTDLPLAVANQADLLVCADPDRIHLVHAKQAVEEIRLRFDPDRAVENERQALANRGVWLHPGRAPATTEVSMLLDTIDAMRFDETLADVATTLGRLGDHDPLDLRRAKAIGVLADPQCAITLLYGDDDGDGDGDTAATNARPSGPRAVLYLHLSEEALHRAYAGGEAAAPVICERLGILTSELVAQWLTNSPVTVRPVLDLARPDATDAHDPPDPMRDAAILRDATCVFPGCRRSSRSCDLDHIVAYTPIDEGGPPGQTSLSNLAPLCRGHHRAKTHGNWAYRRTPEGCYLWTSPTGKTLITKPPSRRPHTPC